MILIAVKYDGGRNLESGLWNGQEVVRTGGERQASRYHRGRTQIRTGGLQKTYGLPIHF